MKKSRFQNLKSNGIKRLAKLLHNCKDITPVIGESLDRMLTLREKLIMKLHLLTCKACRNYLSNLKFMRDTFQKQQELEVQEIPAVTLNDDARERIKNALKKST